MPSRRRAGRVAGLRRLRPIAPGIDEPVGNRGRAAGVALLTLVAVSCAPAQSERPSGPPPEGQAGESARAPEADARGGWRPVWSDEFDGPEIDRDSWNVVVMPDPHNEELQYYTDRADDDPGANAWIQDGALVIEARAEAFEHRAYTSARLSTRGLREFRYGRFEARIRMPSAVGTWPAFWMLGNNIEEVGWPACGEIDIMEGKGRLPTWTSVAIHSGPDPANNRIVSASYLLPRGDFQSQWHVFGVEWEPGEIRWFVDGEPIHRLRRPEDDPPAYWPFDHGHSFFLLLNLAIGGWFDEGHPPSLDMEPQRLLVDWVRVYERS